MYTPRADSVAGRILTAYRETGQIVRPEGVSRQAFHGARWRLRLERLIPGAEQAQKDRDEAFRQRVLASYRALVGAGHREPSIAAVARTACTTDRVLVAAVLRDLRLNGREED